MKKIFTLFFLFLIAGLVSTAQENKDVINIRQRLLQRKSQELDEQIDSFHTLHLMLGGNVYQTEKHVNYAYNPATGRYDFTNEFKYVQPLLNLGDISIVNLKTSFGNDSSDMFSSPDEFALTLKYSGINAVMHANMHTANIRKSTLKRTRDVLNQYDMYHTGAFIDQAERNGNYPLIIEKKGFKIAILNYTKLPSRPDVSKEFVINETDKLVIDRDMRMALAYKPDYIIVYVSYYYKGVEREGIVAYSLGNLLGSDEEIKNRNGYLLDVELRKNRFNRQTQINDWGVIPVYTYYDTTSTPGKTKVFSVPCSAIESGDIFPHIPYIEKRRVINGAYAVRQMLGGSADELQYNLNELIVNNVKETIEITSASLNNKYSLARASDIAPSSAPVTPAPSTDPKSSASLEKIYQQSSGPAQALLQPAADKKATPSAAYNKEKAKAEDAFTNATPPAKKADTASAPVNAADKSKGVDVANIKLDAKPDPNRDKIPFMQFVPDTCYRIQIFALKAFLPMDTNYYDHLKGYEVYEEKDMFKYVIGKYKTFQACYDYWKAQIQPRYKQSFIVKFVNGKRALK